MKRTKTFLIAALATMAMVACGKDDDKTVDKIAGSYTGYTSASFSYSPNPVVTDGETMTITANGDKADIKCTFEQWGELTVNTASVKESGDNAKLTGKGTILMAGMGGGAPSPYDAELDGTVALDKSSFDITIELPSVMGGTTITFKNGTAPEK